MLTTNLELTVHRTLQLASDRRQERAGLSHLLYALTEDPDAVAVLKGCAVDIEKLRTDITRFFDRELAKFATELKGAPNPTSALQRVIQRAAVHVQDAGLVEITGANVLVALLSESAGTAVSFLNNQGMTLQDAVNFIDHGIRKPPRPPAFATGQRAAHGAEGPISGVA